MPAAPHATIVGSIGVSLLLLAFFLNLFKLIRVDGYAYIMLNMIGGALACLSSWMIDFMPFVVLEGTWAVVAAVAFVKRVTRPDAVTLPGVIEARDAQIARLGKSPRVE